ncbi:MAG: ABC transporter permease subunit [Chloroflexi bacterium]|nr:ABC transporter permease subunit [Chloroflexota bacterium]
MSANERSRLRQRYREGRLMYFLMRVALALIVGILGLIVGVIAWRGARELNWEMLTQPPTAGYYLGGGGGICNAILGSWWLAVGATFTAFLLSLPLVLFLNVYARRNGFINRLAVVTRLSLDILWGIPSIVYGIFGFALMLAVGLRASLLGGIIALTLVELPILARSLDEVLRLAPEELYTGTLALGATPLEYAQVLLRQAAPSVPTALLLAFGRGIGDAAAVLFTAGYTDRLPGGLLEPVASLPLAVFFQLATPFPATQARAYAAALVLTIIVLTTGVLGRALSARLSRYVVR